MSEDTRVEVGKGVVTENPAVDEQRWEEMSKSCPWRGFAGSSDIKYCSAVSGQNGGFRCSKDNCAFWHWR